MWSDLIKEIKKSEVFYYSLAFIFIILLWGGLLSPPVSFGKSAAYAFDLFVTKVGWFYLLVVSLFLLFCLWLLVSPYRHIRLGSNDSRPEFSNISWLAMLFSAGMAIGLIFWGGVAEPMSHQLFPPSGAVPLSETARIESLRLSFFPLGGVSCMGQLRFICSCNGLFSVAKGGVSWSCE